MRVVERGKTDGSGLGVSGRVDHRVFSGAQEFQYRQRQFAVAGDVHQLSGIGGVAGLSMQTYDLSFQNRVAR